MEASKSFTSSSSTSSGTTRHACPCGNRKSSIKNDLHLIAPCVLGLNALWRERRLVRIGLKLH